MKTKWKNLITILTKKKWKNLIMILTKNRWKALIIILISLNQLKKNWKVPISMKQAKWKRENINQN